MAGLRSRGRVSWVAKPEQCIYRAMYDTVYVTTLSDEPALPSSRHNRAFIIAPMQQLIGAESRNAANRLLQSLYAKQLTFDFFAKIAIASIIWR